MIRTNAFITRLGAMLVLVAGVHLLQTHLVINFTPSVPATLMLRSEQPPAVGDYITFHLEHTYLPKPARVTKRLVCGPGDQLETREAKFFCNGTYLAEAKSETLGGLPLTPFAWQGPVPTGHAFAMGEHPDSFDSRYWGFVALEQTERAVALF